MTPEQPLAWHRGDETSPSYLAELLRHSNLILSFAQRDIRARYKQTAFGIAWAVIQPFSMMVVFTIVFSKFARINTDGTPYPIFCFSALIFWTNFATTLTQGTLGMTANANLVRKIYFPRETLLLAVILSAALDLGIAFVALLGLFAYYHVMVTTAIVWIIPLFLVQSVFAFSLICLTSAIHVRFRDIGHVLPLGLQLWMLATPVAYPLSVVPQKFLHLFLLNPMAPLIDGYRRALLYGTSPDPAVLGVAFAVATLALCLTYAFFKRAERTFADVI